mmetsp:Transcript_9211/g.25516  ORF Transcript_9211/g.25516 Transcript_9211/m.25516 type:complete len:102 (-) Transcript_9211:25-330(-)
MESNKEPTPPHIAPNRSTLGTYSVQTPSSVGQMLDIESIHKLKTLHKKPPRMLHTVPLIVTPPLVPGGTSGKGGSTSRTSLFGVPVAIPISLANVSPKEIA